VRSALRFPLTFPSFLLAFAAMSEALYSDRFFEGLSTLRVSADFQLLRFPVGHRRLLLSAKP
jgi:hypothetical protein